MILLSSLVGLLLLATPLAHLPLPASLLQALTWTVLAHSLAEPAPRPRLQLDLDADGREYVLQPGTRVGIRLDPRASGRHELRWELLEPPVGGSLRRLPASPPTAAGGVQEWQFEALAPGAQRLRFELRRPGEAKVEPERSYSVLLQVLPSTGASPAVEY